MPRLDTKQIKELVNDVIAESNIVESLTEGVLNQIVDTPLEDLVSEDELHDWATGNGYTRIEPKVETP